MEKSQIDVGREIDVNFYEEIEAPSSWTYHGNQLPSSIQGIESVSNQLGINEKSRSGFAHVDFTSGTSKG